MADSSLKEQAPVWKSMEHNEPETSPAPWAQSSFHTIHRYSGKCIPFFPATPARAFLL